MKKKILFNEQGLKPGTPFVTGQWKEIASHTDFEVKGFFGDYRFLSNFWPAKVFLDDVEYSCVENAYQAAKYLADQRSYLKTCTPREAIIYTRDNPLNEASSKQWDALRLIVMENLLRQKFDPTVNRELYSLLQGTGARFLEETNYWGDIFWGVHKTEASEQGEGENNLGKLLMKVRSIV